MNEVIRARDNLQLPTPSIIESSNRLITIFVRNTQRKAIKLQIQDRLPLSEFKKRVWKRLRINGDKHLLFTQGKLLLSDQQRLGLYDGIIFHLVNEKRVFLPKINIYIKRIEPNAVKYKFTVQSSMRICDFMEKVFSQKYPTSQSYFLVYVGKQLDMSKSFLDEYVQNQCELLAIHRVQNLKTQIITQRSNQDESSIQKNNQKRQQSQKNERVFKQVKLDQKEEKEEKGSQLSGMSSIKSEDEVQRVISSMNAIESKSNKTYQENSSQGQAFSPQKKLMNKADNILRQNFQKKQENEVKQKKQEQKQKINSSQSFDEQTQQIIITHNILCNRQDKQQQVQNIQGGYGFVPKNPSFQFERQTSDIQNLQQFDLVSFKFKENYEDICKTQSYLEGEKVQQQGNENQDKNDSAQKYENYRENKAIYNSSGSLLLHTISSHYDQQLNSSRKSFEGKNSYLESKVLNSHEPKSSRNQQLDNSPIKSLQEAGEIQKFELIQRKNNGFFKKENLLVSLTLNNEGVGEERKNSLSHNMVQTKNLAQTVTEGFNNFTPAKKQTRLSLNPLAERQKQNDQNSQLDNDQSQTKQKKCDSQKSPSDHEQIKDEVLILDQDQNQISEQKCQKMSKSSQKKAESEEKQFHYGYDQNKEQQKYEQINSGFILKKTLSKQIEVDPIQRATHFKQIDIEQRQNPRNSKNSNFSSHTQNMSSVQTYIPVQYLQSQNNFFTYRRSSDSQDYQYRDQAIQKYPNIKNISQTHSLYTKTASRVSSKVSSKQASKKEQEGQISILRKLPPVQSPLKSSFISDVNQSAYKYWEQNSGTLSIGTIQSQVVNESNNQENGKNQFQQGKNLEIGKKDSNQSKTIKDDDEVRISNQSNTMKKTKKVEIIEKIGPSEIKINWQHRQDQQQDQNVKNHFQNSPEFNRSLSNQNASNQIFKHIPNNSSISEYYMNFINPFAYSGDIHDGNFDIRFETSHTSQRHNQEQGQLMCSQVINQSQIVKQRQKRESLSFKKQKQYQQTKAILERQKSLNQFNNSIVNIQAEDDDFLGEEDQPWSCLNPNTNNSIRQGYIIKKNDKNQKDYLIQPSTQSREVQESLLQSTSKLCIKGGGRNSEKQGKDPSNQDSLHQIQEDEENLLNYVLNSGQKHKINPFVMQEDAIFTTKNEENENYTDQIDRIDGFRIFAPENREQNEKIEFHIGDMILIGKMPNQKTEYQQRNNKKMSIREEILREFYQLKNEENMETAGMRDGRIEKNVRKQLLSYLGVSDNSKESSSEEVYPYQYKINERGGGLEQENEYEQENLLNDYL